MTSQGSAYARLRRALDSGNATIALAAASEMPTLGLSEALELCLLLLDQEPEKFTRAAVRWHGRYCREVNAGLEEAQAVLAALGALRSPRRVAAAYALSDLISRRGLQQVCEAVNRWAVAPVGRSFKVRRSRAATSRGTTERGLGWLESGVLGRSSAVREPSTSLRL